VRRMALAGVLILGLAACDTASQGWSGPVTDVICSYAGTTATVYLVIHFAPGAATSSPAATHSDLAIEPGYQAIISQPYPSSVARVAESYGWSCATSTPSAE